MLRLILICTLSAAYMLLEGTFLAAHAKVIRIALEDNANPPRVMNAGPHLSEQNPGLSIELFNKAAKDLGVQIEYYRYPWKRCMTLLENGNIDAVFHASYKKDRESLAVYPKNNGIIDTSKAVFFQAYYFYRNTNDDFTYVADKGFGSDRLIGAKDGYSVIHDLEKEKANLHVTKSTQIGLEMLTANRLHAYVGLENMTDAVIAKNSKHFNTVQKIFPPYKQKPYYLIFSKKFYKENSDLAESFWEQIKTVNGSPSFIALNKKYLLLE